MCRGMEDAIVKTYGQTLAVVAEDHVKKRTAVALELRLADTRDGKHLLVRARPLGREGNERRIASEGSQRNLLMAERF